MAKLIDTLLKNTAVKMLFIGLFLCFPGIAYADYWCGGLISYIGQDSDGSIYVNNGFGVHAVCSTSYDTPSSLANKNMCKGWYAQLLGAKLAGKKVLLHYQDSTGKDASFCSSIGNWVWPQDKIYFVAIVD